MVAKRLGLDAEKEEAASFDFYSPAFREAYFEDVHHPLEDQGVDFWWIDWQQGSHGKMDPLWLLNHYHYLDNCRTGQAGLILSRYGGPGSHRYPIGFSGDTIVTWESLAFNPILPAQLQISVIRGGVTILVAICGATMMKTWLFAGCNLGSLARSIVSIVLVMLLTARNRGFTRLRPVA